MDIKRLCIRTRVPEIKQIRFKIKDRSTHSHVDFNVNQSRIHEESDVTNPKFFFIFFRTQWKIDLGTKELVIDGTIERLRKFL